MDTGPNPEIPVQDEAVTTVSRVQPQPKKARRLPIKKLLLGLLILLLIVSGAAAYWYRDKQAKSDARTYADEIAALNKRLADQQTASPEEEDHSHDEPTVKESETNIAAAISSGNTAALEGYMAEEVRVIIAASEGVGDRTPTQAISDLKYLENGTDPWNFNLSDETLAEYASGGYGSYFPHGAVVGRSANDFVVSFSFDAVGDINGVFMAANAELLTQ